MFNWFKIFNKVEFEATGLPSRTLTLNLKGIGQKNILITKGNELGVLYEGIFLVVGLNGNNPFRWEGLAVYLDENNDVFLGIEIES